MINHLAIRVLFTAVLTLIAVYAEAATYYIDWVAGSDSNNGLSKAAPWKRAPGMVGFAASYSHVAGDRFIFKGGVTWPTSCYQWKVTMGGSAAAWDYYGADVTWYTGASFTRPKFDFERRVINGWSVGAGFLFQGLQYVTIDNLEFANHGAPLQGVGGISTWGCMTITWDSCNYMTLTNSLVRDWWQPNTNGIVPVGSSGGGGIMKINSGSNLRVTHCEFHQLNSGIKCGTAMWNIVTSDNNVIHDTPQAIMSANLVYGNHIYNLQEPNDPAAHANAMLIYGNVQVYNNWIHDTSQRAEVIFVEPGAYAENGTAYIWNNLVYNTLQEPISVDNTGVSPQTSKTYIWNNTLVGVGGVGYCVDVGKRPVPPYSGSVGYIEDRNNHYITTAATALAPSPVLQRVSSNNLLQSPTAASAAQYTVGNRYAPVDATKPTVGAGMNLSARFVDDWTGASRSVPWDIGAWEFASSAPSYGTIVISTSAQSVSEEASSIAVTVYRTGGSSGIVTVDYATSNGTAIAATNYTAATGTLTWASGDAGTRTVNVMLVDANMTDNKTFTFTISNPTGGATVGSPSTQTVTITGSGEDLPPVLSGLTWSVTNMMISAPFYITNGIVTQDSQTLSYALAGKARFRFVPATNGTHQFIARLDAPSESRNSIYFAVNGDPTEPYDAWDIPVTSGFEDRFVGKRGSGTWDDDEFEIWTVDLTAGTTNLVVLAGREIGVQISGLTAELVGGTPTVSLVSITSPVFDQLHPDGKAYFGVDGIIPLTATFTEAVTVTGSPVIPLNSAGEAVYASGSGTTALVFEYTVGDGEDVADLDYVSTNAISLEGGTIQDALGNNAVLIAPAPGGDGSLAASRDIVIDTTAPAVTISGPLPATTYRFPVTFTVTFSDTNLASVEIDPAEVDLTISGWTGLDVGAVTVTGPFQGPEYLITLSDFDIPSDFGTGTVRVVVPAGCGRDFAGNQSPESSVSDPVTVRRASSIRTGILRVNTVIRP